MTPTNVRFASVALAVLGLTSLLGQIGLAAFARPVPDSLPTITTGCVTALAAILPGLRHDDPQDKDKQP